MTENSLGYDFLDPSQPVGMMLLVMGFLFTGMIIFIFTNINQDKDSLADRKKKAYDKAAQLKKIARLYPKKTSF